MSFCTQDILTLASGIYEDLNSPSALSIGYISGVLTSSGFLGNINNRLNCSFWIESGTCIAGGFGAEESDIASTLFQMNYCRQQSMAVMQGGGAFVTTIKDGDSTISMEGKSKLAAEWRAMRKELEDTLRVAVANWSRGHVAPVTVDAASLASYPVP